MAAPSLNKTAMQNIPQLHSEKATKMAGKLLRRPRAPKRQAPSPEMIESKMATSFQLDQLRPLTDYNVTETAPRPSPAPSRAFSLVSPPPPSEVTHKKSVCYEYSDFNHPMQNRGIAFITKEDKKYVLDSIYREKTMTAASQSAEGRSRQRTASDARVSGLLRPVKGRGPDPLPVRPPRLRPEVVPDFADYTDDARYYRPPDFTLENFLVDVAEVQEIPLMRVKRAVYSKHNYNKIIELLKTKLHPQATKVNQVTLSAEGVGIPVKESRIPQGQLLVELAAVIKQHVRDTMNTNVKSVIRPLPKYTPGFGTGSAPHTEIVLYEDTATAVSEQVTQEKQSTEAPTQDSVFSAPRNSFFQGAARSGSPFSTEAVISPSEVAVLDSLVNGGTALSLKAHFICRFPDVSPLINTVTYLNLSFNDFTYVPPEVMEMSQLEVLKLRNNPLSQIPNDISKLSNLRVLVASFCLIDSLPDSLCSLENLVHLNLAYNRLTSLPEDIGKLGSLREMTVEGNQLPAMPRGTLRLKNLNILNVKNNFMHPLFWKDYTQDQPQGLFDLTSMVLHKHGLLGNMDSLPEAIKEKLSRCGTCDSCKGPIFGPGVRIIRPVQKIFSIKYLPFMFRACSSQCKSEFMKKTNVLSQFRDAVK